MATGFGDFPKLNIERHRATFMVFAAFFPVGSVVQDEAKRRLGEVDRLVIRKYRVGGVSHVLAESINLISDQDGDVAVQVTYDARPSVPEGRTPKELSGEPVLLDLTKHFRNRIRCTAISGSNTRRRRLEESS